MNAARVALHDLCREEVKNHYFLLLSHGSLVRDIRELRRYLMARGWDFDDGWGEPCADAPPTRKLRYAPHNDPALHLGKGGKTRSPRTVAEQRMKWLGIRQGQVVGVLRCSPRAWQYYIARERPFPGVMLAALCDLLEMDDDELVDEQHYLRAIARAAETDEGGWPIGD